MNRINNRGQSIMLGAIFGIMIFMVGVLLVNFVDLEVTNFLGTSGLDCDNVDISDGTKLTCLVGELTVPYFIILFVSAAGGVIAARFLV